MKMRVTMSLGVACLLASGAFAQVAIGVAPEPASTPVAAKPKPAEKMICEQQDVIGSRLGGHRVCKTSSQWAIERCEARSDVEHSQNDRTGLFGPH